MLRLFGGNRIEPRTPGEGRRQVFASRADLKTRQLGRTGLMVSEIGFGGWPASGSSWGRRDDARSLVALTAAVDAGVNFIDTALVYGVSRAASA